VQEEGRTIFFSTHLVHEVERVADWVGILEEGQLIYCAPLDQLKAQTRRLVCQFDTPPSAPPEIPGLLQAEQVGKEWLLTVGEFDDTTLSSVQDATSITVEDLSLEDIFVARVGKGAV
jgi:ABC-2 type transport system ATP-binding protein